MNILTKCDDFVHCQNMLNNLLLKLNLMGLELYSNTGH